jgi:hypothetical protein
MQTSRDELHKNSARMYAVRVRQIRILPSLERFILGETYPHAPLARLRRTDREPPILPESKYEVTDPA